MILKSQKMLNVVPSSFFCGDLSLQVLLLCVLPVVQVVTLAGAGDVHSTECVKQNPSAVHDSRNAALQGWNNSWGFSFSF